MKISLIIISIIFIITIILNIYSIKNIKKKNSQIELENKLIEKDNAKLEEINLRLQANNEHLEKEYDKTFNRLNQAKITIDKEIEEKKTKAEKEFEEFCQRLEKNKLAEEEDWNQCKNLLHQSYADLQKEELAALDKVRSTRAAAQKAITREKKIKENKDFYCLPCSVTDKNDIQVLERVKKDLNNPRILSMLIWQTFFRTNAASLCNNVLGTDVITGIYKITNQLTNECYIGQAVDVKKRFTEHMKCGLGIDTPKNNKLYKAMQEDGIWNFSFELLEKCPKEQLNEKERYYIELYMANDFGYNGNKGVNK